MLIAIIVLYVIGAIATGLFAEFTIRNEQKEAGFAVCLVAVFWPITIWFAMWDYKSSLHTIRQLHEYGRNRFAVQLKLQEEIDNLKKKLEQERKEGLSVIQEGYDEVVILRNKLKAINSISDLS